MVAERTTNRCRVQGCFSYVAPALCMHVRLCMHAKSYKLNEFLKQPWTVSMLWPQVASGAPMLRLPIKAVSHGTYLQLHKAPRCASQEKIPERRFQHV
jgi:hypothetical protein